jgi:hypothetical protein
MTVETNTQFLRIVSLRFILILSTNLRVLISFQIFQMKNIFLNSD